MPSQKLRLLGAVFIGLASMLGAGLFVVFRSSYKIAGSFIFAALALAAVVAILNATSVYRLAREIPKVGGVYAYARHYLGETTSFVAGFAFVFGKVGSIAAIALTFQEYIATEFGLWPAALSIAVLTLINIFGIQRTAVVAAVLSITTVAFLAIWMTTASRTPALLSEALKRTPELPPIFAIVQGAALIFFAFAGYARVATLGDEVENPSKNIPKAIVISLGLVLVIYSAIALSLLAGLGSSLAISPAPVAAISNLPAFVTVAAASLATLGSMLALLAGVSRTAAAMSVDRELPQLLQLRNKTGSPWVAEVLIAVAAVGLVSLGQVTIVIGFSSFSVLLYYAIGHLSAWRMRRGVVPILGFLLCVALASCVPGPALIASPIVIAIAWVARLLIRR